MKSMILILCAALGAAGVVCAGTSGVSSSVTKMTPMAIGEHGFLSKQVDLNAAVITKLDAMTTTDGLEPENLNSGLVPSDVVIGSSTVSNKTMKLWLPNGTLTASNIVAGVALPVTSGGTGAGSFTDGGILLGSGTGAITALGAASNGQIPIGDGTTDPVLATITATAGETEISNGAGSITVGLPSAVTGVTTFSNANAKAYILTLEVKSGGTVTVPAGSVAAAAVGNGLTDAQVANDITIASSAALSAASLSATGTVTISEGKLTDSTVVSADIKDGEIVDADVSATAAIAHSKLATDGILDVVAAAASRTEAASALVVTTITFTNVSMVATDTSDEGESVKIADFDAGAFTVLAAILNATCTISAGATGVHYVALGTVAAADDSDLTSTEADVIPKTTLSASGAKAADAVLASTIIFDGTATAKDLYFNWAIDDDNMNANTTNVVTGTLTIISTKAVDNQ